MEAGISNISIFNKTNDEKRFASWIGASLLASIDGFNSLLVKKSDYYELGSDCIIKRNLL